MMTRDWNTRRRTFEMCVALEIARDLTRTLGPVRPEMLAGKNQAIGAVFGDALDRNEITDEAAAERILHFVPPFLADLHRGRAELDARLAAAISEMGRPGVPARCA
jgi:hypothetical protein